jgi:hypothetical protein
MIKILPLIFVSLFLTGSLFAQSYNPDLELLKPHRTYVGLSEVGPLEHHFIATFIDREASQIGFGGNSPEEIAKLTKGKFQGGFGLVPGADKTKPVPEALKELEEAAIKKVLEFYEDAKDIHIAYEGKYRKLVVEEIIPEGRIEQSVFNRPAVKSTIAQRYDPVTGKIEPDYSVAFESMGPGFGMLAIKGLPDLNAVGLRWLPIVLSPSIEGFSIVTEFENKSPIYEAEYARYLQILKSTIEQIDQSTYSNPIRAIVSRQGENLFPDLYQGYGIIQADVYARAEDPRDRRSFGFSIKFPVAEAIKGKIAEGSQEIPELHLRMKWQMNLKSKVLKAQFYRVTDGGEVFLKDATYEVLTRVIEEGDHAKIELGGFKLKGADESKGSVGVRLPGNDQATSIDVYHIINTQFTAIDIYINRLIPNVAANPVGDHPISAPEISWEEAKRTAPAVNLPPKTWARSLCKFIIADLKKYFLLR